MEPLDSGLVYASDEMTIRSPRVATAWAALLLGAVALLGAAPEPSTGTAAPERAVESPPPVLQVRIDSIIHPVAKQLLIEALDEAARIGSPLVVVELDTPGGILSTTREMFTAMLGAPCPVAVLVAPAGAQAASAGFFLLMAADFAAMAPGTNTGAAHPVGGAGETIEGVMGEKVEQDAAATIRSLAARRGRDVALAEEAVVKSRSFTADEAFEKGLIDALAPDVPRLLTALDGRSWEKPGAGKGVLAVKDAPVRRIEMSAFQRLLSALAHPNIAYLLMSLGFLGLYFELAHPGVVLPGVIGGICLLLGLFALSVLPVSYAGVGLLLLAVVFFVAEIKVTSYGLLTVGGIISLVLGSLLLFRSPDPAMRLSRSLIFAVAVVAAAIALLLALLVARSQRAPVRTGKESLLGARAVARTRLAPAGKVFLQGEWWNAVADGDVPAGAEVEVIAVDEMTLKVRPTKN